MCSIGSPANMKKTHGMSKARALNAQIIQQFSIPDKDSWIYMDSIHNSVANHPFFSGKGKQTSYKNDQKCWWLVDGSEWFMKLFDHVWHTLFVNPRWDPDLALALASCRSNSTCLAVQSCTWRLAKCSFPRFECGEWGWYMGGSINGVPP